MMAMRRLCITYPLERIRLSQHKAVLQEAERLGYTDAWSSEVNGSDAFTPIAAAAAWTEKMRFGTAIADIYTRSPMLIAMNSVAASEAAPGRFCLGLDTSSPAIVEKWNGVQLKDPLRRMRETLAFLRQALAGERISMTIGSYQMHGAKLARKPEPSPPIYIAALREQMLRLAGEQADGVIINFLSPADAVRVVKVARDAARATGRDPEALDVAARIFVVPTEDPQVARMLGRVLLSAYLTTPYYYAFHEWLGRGSALSPVREAWQAGERPAAMAAMPEGVIDDILVYGNRQQIIDKIEAYRSNGVDTPVIAIIPTSQDPAEQAKQGIAAVKNLAPS